MDAEELHHYFDYCSELVSLIAKTAALCAERTSDPVVLNTVSEIETLAAQMTPEDLAEDLAAARALSGVRRASESPAGRGTPALCERCNTRQVSESPVDRESDSPTRR